jgi:sRNA-binding carbon storage regulator CsrA
MLVLSRKAGEGLSFTLPDETVVRIYVEPTGHMKIKCVIDAPASVRIDRLADTGKRTNSRTQKRSAAEWITKSITR